MPLTRLTSTLFLIVILIFSSCKKNTSEEFYTPDPVITVPDLTVKVNTSVSGYIVDENNEPLGGAQVYAGTKQAMTDEFGFFKISGIQLPKTAGFITVYRTGYFTSYKTFIPTADKESFVRLGLLASTQSGTFMASVGGTVTTADGAKISLQDNGVVLAGSSTSYTGTVHVSIRPFNAGAGVTSAGPGDGRGIDSAGHLKILTAFGTLGVELTADNGSRLQLAEGKPATINIPIVASAVASAPSSIALWSLDETTGLWKQEGTAIKSGNVYTATVKHFSFWEGADPSVLVNFTAQVVNPALQPLANVPVVINVAGQSNNGIYAKFGYTDANGVISGPIPANNSLVLSILTPCSLPVYSYNFTTATTNVDLGTLTGNVGQNLVTITGTALNCNGQPITNGYVQTYDNGFYNHIAINNGSFTYSGLACTNGPISYIVVDESLNKQSVPESFSLVSGGNNFGTLTACGISSVSYVTYVFDGTTYNLGDPEDTLGVYTTNNMYTDILNLDHPGAGYQGISMEIRGPVSTAGSHTSTDIFLPQFPSGHGVDLDSVYVTFTEYGPVGGFVSGYFSTTNIRDLNDASVHSLSMNFRIKRYN